MVFAIRSLPDGWRGARTPFLVAIVLDCTYQLVTVRFIYPLELLFTATLLALIPYIFLRGPFNRIAPLFLPPAGRAADKEQPEALDLLEEAQSREGSKRCRTNPSHRTGPGLKHALAASDEQLSELKAASDAKFAAVENRLRALTRTRAASLAAH
jgi:hypothetical protein